MNSLMNPTIGDISVAFEERDRNQFLRLHLRLFLLVAGIGAVSLAGISLLGEPAMVLLYGEKIRPHVYLMNMVLCTTLMYALCCVLQNTLVILRKLRIYLLISVISLGLTVILGRTLISRIGPNGVSVTISLSYLLFFLCALLVFGKEVRSWEKQGGIS